MPGDKAIRPTKVAKVAGATDIQKATGDGAAMRFLILIDITGSMSNEIEGVKKMVEEFVRKLEHLDLPLTITIITFTEDRTGCYVSLMESESFSSVLDYVRAIELCRPPDCPGVNASGEDGPENQKAALHRLVDLDPLPTVGFLITDAPPHLRVVRRPCITSEIELAWLASRGLSTADAQDFFHVLNQVIEHFEGDLVMNCIICSNHDDGMLDVYGAVASMTGGMLMKPVSRSAEVLATGMMDVVSTMLSQLSNEDIEAVQQLEGFSLYDVSVIGHRENEQDNEGYGRLQIGDNQTLFNIAMKRSVAVCGRKWSKRAVGMSCPLEQLKLVWHTAKYLMRHQLGTDNPCSLDAELAGVYQLHDDVKGKMAKGAAGHFTLKVKDIADMLSKLREALDIDSPSPPTSIITMESIGEALAEDAVWDDWLHTVMKLLMGYPLQLSTPLDRDGKPDFADAWSSVALAVGCDRMTSADFMHLLGDQPTVAGPTDRNEYNSFLVLADPQDALGSLVYKVASGTQVLNYITGILMGAKGFLPNLHVGIACATLMRLFREGAAFHMEQAQQIVHSLRLHCSSAAPSLMRSMTEDGVANPADAIPKLLSVVVRVTGQPEADHTPVSHTRVLALLLEEWIHSEVQYYYGKTTPESDKAYFASLLGYLPLKELLPEAAVRLDPLEKLHVLEQPHLTEACLCEGWEESWWVRLEQGASDGALPPHPVLEAYKERAVRLLQLLAPGSQLEHEGIAAYWPDWKQGVCRALLQRKRSERYRCLGPVSEGSTELKWERLEERSLGSLAIEFMQDVFKGHLAKFREERTRAARTALLAAASQAIQSHSSDEAATLEALSGLYVNAAKGEGMPAERPASLPVGPVAQLHNVTVRLDRADVPDMLSSCGATSFSVPSLKALITGSWSTLPPQSLRRSTLVKQLIEDQPELENLVMGRMLCAREGGNNRLGHSLALQYPGPAGWSDEYATERLSKVPRKAAYVQQMHRFTEMAAWAQSLCTQQSTAAQVQAVLALYDDANRMDKAKCQLESLLSSSMPSLDGVGPALDGVHA